MEFLTREKRPVLSGDPDPGDPEDSSLVNLDWFVGTEPGEYRDFFTSHLVETNIK